MNPEKKKYKIGVVTTTRAEYGLLKLSIQKVMNDDKLELCLIVSGAHLVKDQGYTIEEILADDIPIAERIGIFDGNLFSSMGKAVERFADCYHRLKIDMLVVLGDRYELIPICYPAVIMNIPIAHISGGEVTEGAIDDTIRHCITKMSYLHFVGCEAYRKRVIQLGESPDRVFSFGDHGIENIRKMDYLSRQDLFDYLGIDGSRDIALVTFHPVTHEEDTAREQAESLISVMSEFEGIDFIITMSNMDTGSSDINELFIAASKQYENMHMYSSLGSKRYLSALRFSKAVIGNSSSGIVEAPSFGIPTVNIGDRQKGRLKASSVIDCDADRDGIKEAMDKAFSDGFKKLAAETENPYESGEFSTLLVKTIREYLIGDRINLKKKFFDIEFEY